MANLRDFERRLGDLIEGFFGKAFRSALQPVELAKRILREMENGKTVGLRTVWVPNRYAFSVSTVDREHFSQAENALARELEQVVIDGAKERGWGLLGKPEVTFETDEELGRGQFRARAELVESEAVETGAHTAFLPAASAGEPQPKASGAGAELLLDDGSTNRTFPLDRDSTMIGRMAECEVVLSDAGASRRHAEIQRRNGDFVLVDLQSTNGTLVNGRAVQEHPLEDGDRITIGRTTLEFRRTGG